MFASLMLVIGLLVLNALFAMGEMALISVKKSRLQALAIHSKSAERALELANLPQSFLPTVQVGVTLVSIIEGAFGPGHLERGMMLVLEHIPVLAPFAEKISASMVVVLITFGMLLFGELMPKRLALLYPEQIAMALAAPLTVLAKLCAPAVFLLNFLSDGVLKCFGLDLSKGQAMTEEELRAAIFESMQSGVLEREEGAVIERLLRLADRPVRAIMTPRNELFWINRRAPYSEIVRKLRRSPYSRIVVCDGDVDHPVGVVLAQDIMDKLLQNRKFSVDSVMRIPPVVPDSLTAQGMIERLRDVTLGMVFVLDEYGSFEGIVTPSNLIEAIFGEDQVRSANLGKEQSKALHDVYELDGVTPPEEVSRLLDIPPFPFGDRYLTIAGVVLAFLKRLPVVGDKVTYHGWIFEVTRMERRRIDEIKATRIVSIVDTDASSDSKSSKKPA